MGSEPLINQRFSALKHALGSSHDTSFERATGAMGHAPQCPRCGAFIGMREWLPPFCGTVELHGQGFGDFMRGPGSGFLITTHLADAFRAEGLTGLQGFHPVEITRVRGRRRGSMPVDMPQYVYVIPVFGSAAVDETRSRIRRSDPIRCDWCRETGVDSVHGFCLEPGSWNGDDMFFARGMPGTVIVSERFVGFVQRHGFTNMRLTPIEEYVWAP